MERAYLNINIPNIISVGLIAAVLYLGFRVAQKVMVK